MEHTHCSDGTGGGGVSGETRSGAVWSEVKNKHYTNTFSTWLNSTTNNKLNRWIRWINVFLIHEYLAFSRAPASGLLAGLGSTMAGGLMVTILLSTGVYYERKKSLLCWCDSDIVVKTLKVCLCVFYIYQVILNSAVY